MKCPVSGPVGLDVLRPVRQSTVAIVAASIPGIADVTLAENARKSPERLRSVRLERPQATRGVGSVQQSVAGPHGT